MQGALVATLLIGSIGPHGGSAALYVPLIPDGLGPAAGWLARHDAAVIGQGRIPGTLIVRGKFNFSVFSALPNGALLVAAPAALCGDDLLNPDGTVR